MIRRLWLAWRVRREAKRILAEADARVVKARWVRTRGGYCWRIHWQAEAGEPEMPGWTERER